MCCICFLLAVIVTIDSCVLPLKTQAIAQLHIAKLVQECICGECSLGNDLRSLQSGQQRDFRFQKNRKFCLRGFRPGICENLVCIVPLQEGSECVPLAFPHHVQGVWKAIVLLLPYLSDLLQIDSIRLPVTWHCPFKADFQSPWPGSTL